MSTAEAATRSQPADAPAQPLLVVTLGGREVGRYAVDRRTMTIGRHPDNDITLDADGVSRRHAQVITVQGDSLVEDLASRNGTFVNNAFVKVRQLRDGDEIVIAKFRIRFSRDGASAAVADAPTAETAGLLRRWKRAMAATPSAEKAPCPLCGQAREA